MILAPPILSLYISWPQKIMYLETSTNYVGAGIVTDYGVQAGWPEFGPRQGQEILVFSTTSRPQPTLQWVPGLFPGVKRPGNEADHPPPSSAEVKNGRAIPPLPHTASWRGA
jgi:hypothetical protein